MRTRALVVGGVALVTVIAGVAVAASASAGTTTYEAEAAERSGGARVAACERCSGGSRVTALGELTFTGVVAERNGPAKIQVSYAAVEDRTARISVNGGVATAVVFPATRGADRIGTARIVLSLRTGDNRITFGNPAGPAPDLDKIVITTDGTPPTLPPTGTSTAVPAAAAVQSAPPTPTPATSPEPSRPAGTQGKPETELIKLVNAERAKAGCAPVSADPKLTAAAQAHSADMAARGYYEHTGPDGVDFAGRITAAGFRWTAVAENIAKGAPSPAEAMADWVASPGHRANIVNCTYLSIGVGIAADAGGALLWTQDFGRAG